MKISTICGMMASAVVVALGASPVHAGVDQITLLASGTQSYANNSGGTLFSLSGVQTVGSGVFSPFVRISRKDMEQGYNTADPASTLDDHANGPAVPVIPFDSVVDSNRAVILVLDTNEPGSASSPVTLLNLVMVVSANSSKSGPSSGTPWSVQSIPADPGDVTIYDMSTLTDNSSGNPFTITINADDNLATGKGGSGQGDLAVRVDLTGEDLSGIFDGNHYLYVYSLFEGPGLGSSQGGFEEWRIYQQTCLDCGGSVPEPASLGILGLGAAGLLLRRRKA